MKILTAEDRIMGRTEPKEKTELELKAFTADTKYIVCADGSENKKVVDGIFVEKILSYDSKQEVLKGKLVIKANGLVIERIEEEPKEVVISEMETVEEELPKPKRRKAK